MSPSTSEVSDREATRVFSRIGKGETQSGARRKNAPNDKRVCFYCLDSSHLISDCKAWKQKNSASKSKSVALVHPVCEESHSTALSYQPFLLTGSVSVSVDSECKPVTILRDTGSVQSFILEELFPRSTETYSGADVLIRGIGMQCINVPLHNVYLKSDLVSGTVRLGVHSQLPVEGVGVILGNDLAGGEVFPRPIVVHTPKLCEQPNLT